MNSEPRQGQLPAGPILAALGAVLLIVSLFLDWYETFTAFTTFEFLDLLLLLLALAAIAALAGEMRLVAVAVPAGVSLAVALLALLVVLSQVVNHPPAATALDKDLGIWLALAGAALMVAGAVLGNARISLAVETRARGPASSDSTADHDATTVAAPAPSKPKPEPGRPVGPERGDDPDPTRPLSDPDAPRGPRRP